MFEFICHERTKSVKYVRILQEWGVRGRIVSTIRLPRYPRKGTLFPLAMPSGGVRRREGGLIRAGGAFNFTFVCCCRKAAFHLGVWGGGGGGGGCKQQKFALEAAKAALLLLPTNPPQEILISSYTAEK